MSNDEIRAFFNAQRLKSKRRTRLLRVIWTSLAVHVAVFAGIVFYFIKSSRG